MIRLLGFLIRSILSLILVALGIVFFGPYLVETVDQMMEEAEEASPSTAERFQAIERVRELLNQKEMSDIGFDDLLKLIGSEDSSSDGEARPSRLEVDKLGLTPSDIEVLRGLYRDFLGEEKSATSEEPSSAVEPGIHGSTFALPATADRSDGLTSVGGL